MKKNGLYGYVYHISVDCDVVTFDYILDIYKYLNKKAQYEIMFGPIKKCLLNHYVLGCQGTVVGG